MAPTDLNDSIYDVLGLGFGPANLSVATALAEAWSVKKSDDAPTCPIRNALFIDKHHEFQWHPGMLLPDARMQISFMKDLATLRNPQSPFTFLAYLHSQDRLLSFINRGSNIPTRKEFSDYLSWAAQRVQKEGVEVIFGHEVVGVSEGPQDTIQVRTKNLSTGEERLFRARDVILSPGGSARVPSLFNPFLQHPRLLHSSSYALMITGILDDLLRQSRPLRIAVVGSGQSAAEVTLNLRERLSGTCHEIDMIMRRGSLKPSDDSPFANEIFDPASTDMWFSLMSDRVRNEMLAEYRSTNYGVVNPRTLDQVYEVIYDQRLNGGIGRRTGLKPTTPAPIINLRPYTSIIAVEEAHPERDYVQPCCETTSIPVPTPFNTFRIVSQHVMTREISEHTYDAVICATGYHRSGWVDILKHSDLGKRFGLHSTSDEVRLLPASRLGSSRPRDFSFDDSNTPSPFTSSSLSTPPTSPGQSLATSLSGMADVPTDLYVSRNYELLAVSGETKRRRSRVYIQGVEEMTHGLSDTLLSVVGVRAAEVLADILKGY